MLMPSIFGETLFDDFMNDFAFPDIDRKLYGKHAANLMKTDVKEKDNTYEVAIDLPGFKKDEIQDEKDKEGKYVRRERYAGNVSRSFYVGNRVQKEDIHPKYENGILSLTVPKGQKAVEEKANYIAIEG